MSETEFSVPNPLYAANCIIFKSTTTYNRLETEQNRADDGKLIDLYDAFIIAVLYGLV